MAYRRPLSWTNPRMRNAVGPHLEQWTIAFSLAHPGFGRRQISAELLAQNGVACGSLNTASGGCCATSGSTPAPGAWR